LCERLSTTGGDLTERFDLRQRLLGEEVRGERVVATCARPFGCAVQVPVREHPLRERREDDAPDPLVAEDVEQIWLDPPVQHRVRRLMDQEWRAEVAEDRGRFARLLRRV